MFFYGAGGWSPARIHAEMVAERWQMQQDAKARKAAELAATGHEVFIVDEADENWTFD